MSYEVVAPLVLAKDRAGIVHYAYEGAKLREDVLDPTQAKHLLAEGLIVAVSVPDPDPDPADEDPDLSEGGAGDGGESNPEDPGEGDDEPGIEKPPRIALKGVLVDWLVENTEGYTRDDLEKLNKDDLWDLIDAVEAPEASGSEN